MYFSIFFDTRDSGFFINDFWVPYPCKGYIGQK